MEMAEAVRALQGEKTQVSSDQLRKSDDRFGL